MSALKDEEHKSFWKLNDLIPVYFFFRCGVVLIGQSTPVSPLRLTHTVPWNTGKVIQKPIEQLTAI